MIDVKRFYIHWICFLWTGGGKMVKRSNPDQYQLRLPPGMRDRLREAAEANSRSMNAEIVARLEETLDSTVFETALHQNETLQLQGETIEKQGEVLQTQSMLLKDLRKSLDAMNRNLAAFAFAIQDAADGDMSSVQHFIELAKKRPIRADLSEYVIDPAYDPKGEFRPPSKRRRR